MKMQMNIHYLLCLFDSERLSKLIQVTICFFIFFLFA